MNKQIILLQRLIKFVVKGDLNKDGFVSVFLSINDDVRNVSELPPQKNSLAYPSTTIPFKLNTIKC